MAVNSPYRSAPDERPNVVLFVGEDHGRHYGCYGDGNAWTPFIDTLAAEGVRYDTHQTTCPICSPGRASILTGLHPFQNGQINLSTHRYSMYRPFRNLVGELRRAGYYTGRFGKLHVLPGEAFPFDFSWNDPDRISFSHRDTDAAAAVAKSFASRAEAAKAPFFAYVCPADAHLPLLHQSHGLPVKPRGADDINPPDFCPVPGAHMRDRLAAYYNCLERLDKTVERVLESLWNSNGRDTVVLVTADHGQQFPRGKLTLYEGGLQVPLIIYAPGRVSAGTVRNTPGSHVDILPTILDLLGMESVEGRPGKSLLGHENTQPEYVMGEWTGSPLGFFPQRSIRDSRYKLIVNHAAGEPGARSANCGYMPPGLWETSLRTEDLAAAPDTYLKALETACNPPQEELYDLCHDPCEYHNLAGDPKHNEILDTLRRALQAWQIEHDDRITDPVVRATLKDMYAEIAGRHYPKGPGHLPDHADGIVWHYGELIDPGILE